MQLGWLSSIVLGFMGFLLAWAGRHLLDRLLLPRVVDWWALQNKKWAMERAVQLLKQLEMESKYASDTRHFILFLEDRTATIVLTLGLFNAVGIIIIIGWPVEPESQQFRVVITLILLLVPVTVVLLLYALRYVNRRFVSLFTDAQAHWDETIARLNPLLRAAGLSEKEIKDWLEKVPSVPVTLQARSDFP
jgi:hypothetical protein